MSKPDRSSEWREMKAEDGSILRVPPYTDANTYTAKGYSFASPAKPKAKAKPSLVNIIKGEN